MKARLHTRIKEQLPDGSIISVVIWMLPEGEQGRSIGFKYRLNYSASDGTTLVRYDNERGKGDHKHLGTKQSEYRFESIEKLVKDFFADVRSHGGEL